MSTEIKPCPFCGKQASKFAGRAICGNAGCVLGGSMPVDAWSNRPIEDRLNAEIEALKADRELLDWLDKNHHFECVEKGSSGPYEVWFFHAPPCGSYNTARVRIKAAMDRAKGNQPPCQP